jgi:hypothetical protein
MAIEVVCENLVLHGEHRTFILLSCELRLEAFNFREELRVRGYDRGPSHRLQGSMPWIVGRVVKCAEGYASTLGRATMIEGIWPLHE